MNSSTNLFFRDTSISRPMSQMSKFNNSEISSNASTSIFSSTYNPNFNTNVKHKLKEEVKKQKEFLMFAISEEITNYPTNKIIKENIKFPKLNEEKIKLKIIKENEKRSNLTKEEKDQLKKMEKISKMPFEEIVKQNDLRNASVLNELHKYDIEKNNYHDVKRNLSSSNSKSLINSVNLMSKEYKNMKINESINKNLKLKEMNDIVSFQFNRNKEKSNKVVNSKISEPMSKNQIEDLQNEKQKVYDLNKWEKNYLDPDLIVDTKKQNNTIKTDKKFLKESRQILKDKNFESMKKTLVKKSETKKDSNIINFDGTSDIALSQLKINFNLAKTFLSMNTIIILNEKGKLNELLFKKYSDFIVEETDNESMCIFLKNLHYSKKSFNFSIFGVSSITSKQVQNIITNYNLDFENPARILEQCYSSLDYVKLSSIATYREFNKARIIRENTQRNNLKQLVLDVYKLQFKLRTYESTLHTYKKKMISFKSKYNDFIKELEVNREELKERGEKLNYSHRLAIFKESDVKEKIDKKNENNSVSNDEKSLIGAHEIKKILDVIQFELGKIDKKIIKREKKYGKTQEIFNEKIKQIENKINNLNKKINEYNLEIKENVIIQIDYYKHLLKKGIDNRRDGLVWIIKRLIELNVVNFESTMFPKYFNLKTISTIVNIAFLEIELSQTQLVYTHLKRILKTEKDYEKLKFSYKLNFEYSYINQENRLKKVGFNYNNNINNEANNNYNRRNTKSNRISIFTDYEKFLGNKDFFSSGKFYSEKDKDKSKSKNARVKKTESSFSEINSDSDSNSLSTIVENDEKIDINSNKSKNLIKIQKKNYMQNMSKDEELEEEIFLERFTAYLSDEIRRNLLKNNIFKFNTSFNRSNTAILKKRNTKFSENFKKTTNNSFKLNKSFEIENKETYLINLFEKVDGIFSGDTDVNKKNKMNNKFFELFSYKITMENIQKEISNLRENYNKNFLNKLRKDSMNKTATLYYDLFHSAVNGNGISL